MSLCNNSTLAGFTDWRLPTIDELRTICDNQTLIGNFDVGDARYWSSTPYKMAGYVMQFHNGCGDTTYYGPYPDASLYVRCVR